MLLTAPCGDLETTLSAPTNEAPACLTNIVFLETECIWKHSVFGVVVTGSVTDNGEG